MDYYVIKLECKNENYPIAQAILEFNLITGWTEEDTVSGKQITFYLPKDEAGKTKLDEISKRLISEKIDFSEDILKGEDWEHTWKLNFKTRKLENIIVTPSWLPYSPKDDEKIIEIEPGMAFGTGDHATTALCILLLQKYQITNANMLDLGTGSGILAMASSLIGGGTVIGIDNDSIAVTEANQNLIKNKLEDKITIKLGNAFEEISGEFDMVCANLFLHQVESLLKSNMPFLKQEGIFIGSGITAEQKPLAEKAISESNFELLEIIQEGLWIAFAAVKKL